MSQQALEPASAGGRSEMDGVGSDTRPARRLPNELLAQVVELACRSPPHPTSQRASAPSETYGDSLSFRRTALDIPTTLNLAQARDCHQMAVSILFSHIRIARPSALQSLSETLTARPDLGRLVKSLHLGPDDLIRDAGDCDFWWPHTITRLEMDMDGRRIVYVSASLSGPKDEAMIPRWCEGGLHFPVKPPPRQRDCRFIAISRAFAAAQRAIDVTIKRSNRAFTGGKLSMPLWVMRILEAQAALDLYLAAMRRLEEDSDDFQRSWRSRPASLPEDVPYLCRKGRCGHYPALDVVRELPDNAPQETLPAGSTIKLSRDQLLRHIFRAGALTDRFDHPLLPMRSGMVLERLRRTGRTGRGYHTRRFNDQDDRFLHVLSPIGLSYDGLSITPLHLKEVLGQARAILARVPQMSNLSLTGFLELAFRSTQPPPVLPALRAVSLGPPPPYHVTPLALDIPALTQLEKLRICGVMLVESELRSIAKHLRRLKVIEWTMAEEFDDHHSISLEDTVTALVHGVHRSSPPPRLFQDDGEIIGEQEDGRNEGDISPKVESKDPRWTPPLIHVKLHSEDLSRLLDRAPSPELREAWLSGEARPELGGCRLVLAESRATQCEGSRRTVASMDDGWGVLYDEGREWWDAEAQM